jgi:hypothetical protein
LVGHKNNARPFVNLSTPQADKTSTPRHTMSTYVDEEALSGANIDQDGNNSIKMDGEDNENEADNSPDEVAPSNTTAPGPDVDPQHKSPTGNAPASNF